jgi:2-hydroxychromene-2-carboxylate isomerase
LGPLFARFDENLSEVREYIKLNEERLVSEIEINQASQKDAGHHGVPLNVYKGKYYFGQDDPFDELINELIKDGIIEDFS